MTRGRPHPGTRAALTELLDDRDFLQHMGWWLVRRYATCFVAGAIVGAVLGWWLL